MAKGQKLIDMELDDEASMDYPMPIAMPDKPRYPYGLRICLGDDELKKLKLDMPRIGETIELRAMAEVTCTSNEHGVRVELQIQKLAVENETDEPADDPDAGEEEGEKPEKSEKIKDPSRKRVNLRDYGPIGD